MINKIFDLYNGISFFFCEVTNKIHDKLDINDDSVILI